MVWPLDFLLRLVAPDVLMKTDVSMGLCFVFLLILGRGLASGLAHLRASHGNESFLHDVGRLPSPSTDRPVIGILSMELSPKVRELFGDHDSYIAASYVKFVEGAGARVAPILIGQDAEYYREMAQRVNGLLLPGGATYFDSENGYGEAGKALYREARRLNEQQGTYFPVLGICLGMELLAVAAAGREIRVDCDSHEALPLQFLPGSRDSRLFSKAPPTVIHTLQRENVTVNQHMYCVTREAIERSRLNEEWEILTVSKDKNGKEFVSVLEHKKLPFYGLQFHPEKNIYEWKRSKNYPHSEFAVESARFFADFLISEARRNENSFGSEKKERANLIYRHQPTYTGDHLLWEQLYFFTHQKRNSSSPTNLRTPSNIQADFE